MSKLKAPLLSLEAHGSLGNTVSYKRRHPLNIAEKKPVLPYFLTLPVQYQRWLFQDYAYLWTKQTAAVKRNYEKLGSPYHLTGTQYWMKVMLATLPDIAGWWRLDANTGPTTPDSSRSGNTATIYGASPATGAIDGALSHDGLNDYEDCGTKPVLDITNNFTLEAWIALANNVRNDFIGKKTANRTFIFYKQDNNKLRFIWSSDGGPAWAYVDSISTIDSNLHPVAITFASGLARLYIDGIQNAVEDLPGAPSIYYVANGGFLIGKSNWSTSLATGIIDNVILYSRVLDATEIKRHSERRYP